MSGPSISKSVTVDWFTGRSFNCGLSTCNYRMIIFLLGSGRLEITDVQIILNYIRILNSYLLFN